MPTKPQPQRPALPELLAPAGTLESALAAFDAGADAVYLGLEKFNARERGTNFSLEDAGRLITYAHLHSRKVYVTMNTLIKEGELPAVAALLTELSELSPDAVIVQDLGLVRLLREHFPELSIHASTQMGIHNSAGVNLLASRGVQRVILDRQVTHEELKRLLENTQTQIEVFVHGALCLSLSGSCLLSSWLGGWSGNRGKCKQPCRRRYFSKNGNGFFLSTHDLYSLDSIPTLKQLGVASLKIEGRLRGPDYVSNVVTAYRGMLDAANEAEEKVALTRGRDLLARGFGRKWGEGFRHRSGFDNIVQHNQLGVSGLLCGDVVGTTDNGFIAKVTRNLSIGDRIRIQPPSGDEGPALTVTKMTVHNRPVRHLRRDGTGFIHCDKEIPRDGRLFLIGRDISVSPKRLETLPQAAESVDLDVRVDAGGIHVTSPSCPGQAPWAYPLDVPAAQKRPLSPQAVVDIFSGTILEAFRPGCVRASIAGERFLQERDLRQARRAFWDWFEKHHAAVDTVAAKAARLREITALLSEPAAGRSCSTPGKVVQVDDRKRNPFSQTLTARPIYEAKSDTQEIILPAFCSEHQLKTLQENIGRLAKRGTRRIRVTSLYALALLEGLENLHITTSFPLPACNSLAVEELLELGAGTVQAWVELDRQARSAMISRVGARLEHYVYGRLPVLATRAKLPVTGKIRDSRGNTFSIATTGDMTYLLPEAVLSIPAMPDTEYRVFLDLSHASPGEKTTSAFNLDQELM